MTQAKLSANEIRQAFDEMAPDYNQRLWFDTHILGVGRLRSKLMRRASGRILDVGCGTGSNFAHFPVGSQVYGVDLSEGMLEEAQRTARELGLEVNLQVMDAEQLTFDDDEFDTVVSALSTCTYPDPVGALKEMQRVCRRDGQILLLEHGRSQLGLLAAHQDKTAEAHYVTHAGCRWNQDPISLVESAGLTVAHVQRATLGVFYLIQAKP